MSLLGDILETALPASTSVALAASGEMLNERTGTLNLGQEGVLSLGAVAAFIVGTNVRDPFLALGVGMLVGAAAGVVFATAAVVVRANQVLAGLALAVGGVGLANQLGNGRQGALLISRFEPVEIPGLSDIPIVGSALFDQDPVVYFAFYVLPVVLWFLLFRTRHGLNLRAVGENPAAADAAGVNVTGMRFTYATIGAALSGAGGAHLVLGYTQNWSIGVVSGAGWVSLAVVIFAAWRPFLVVLGSLLFGAMTSLGFVAQARQWNVPSYVLAMLPYLVTLVLILVPAGPGNVQRAGPRQRCTGLSRRSVLPGGSLSRPDDGGALPSGCVRRTFTGCGHDYILDDDRDRVDVDALWVFLSTKAYWARWRQRSDVEAQLRSAWRVVGAYDETGMVGFSRAISDGVAIAYLADVYVEERARGDGLGIELVTTMIEWGPGSQLRLMLHTRDAHGLYERFGFGAADETYLERPPASTDR